jgi:HlyD family secretion protein
MNQVQRWAIVPLAALVLAACAPGGAASDQAASATTTVQRGTITLTVSSSGTVEPARATDLSFASSGTVAEVFVEEGQRVTQGQVLASIDPRDLHQQVVQAEANLQTARAQLEQTRSGNATPEQLAAQEASVRSAQANLQKTRSGSTTAADIASQQAAVRQAEANLQKTRSGTTTAADIASAEAQVRSAEAQLRAAQTSITRDQVAAAEAQLRQAQENLQKTEASASASKTTAYESMTQSADQVRQAQENYSKAFWDNDQAQNGRNPQTGGSFADEGLDEDVQQRQYEGALRDAELQLSQAQSKLDQAVVAYENARQAEINDVATARSQVDSAQVALDELLKGPRETDVAQAQAALDQARANLAKLTEGPNPADVASAQAQLDQARANLQKLQQGGTAADIAASQAQVDQAQAQLQQLTTPKAPSDIEIAEANVTQAESQLRAAELALSKASLLATFNGVITAANVAAGGSSSGTTGGAAFTLVDPSRLHLDVNVSESDVAQIQEGQAAQITIDALGTDVITGTVAYIAPAATNVDNVTTYLVRVELPQDNDAIRVGMTASVDIETDEKTDVLVVPSSAVRAEGNRRIVRKQNGETFVDTEVRVGLQTDRETEIVSGLNEGDVIAQLATVPDAGQ